MQVCQLFFFLLAREPRWSHGLHRSLFSFALLDTSARDKDPQSRWMSIPLMDFAEVLVDKYYDLFPDDSDTRDNPDFFLEEFCRIAQAFGDNVTIGKALERLRSHGQALRKICERTGARPSAGIIRIRAIRN